MGIGNYPKTDSHQVGYYKKNFPKELFYLTTYNGFDEYIDVDLDGPNKLFQLEKMWKEISINHTKITKDLFSNNKLIGEMINTIAVLPDNNYSRKGKYKRYRIYLQPKIKSVILNNVESWYIKRLLIDLFNTYLPQKPLDYYIPPSTNTGAHKLIPWDYPEVI